MTDSITPKKEQRMPLAAWMEAHKNPDLSMDDRHARRVQSTWVDKSLRHMVLRSLVSTTDPRMVDPNEFLTVDGSYMVGELELPVYRFDIDGVIIKLRHDTRDWCIRVWNTTNLYVAPYLVEAMLEGDYSVLGDEDTEPTGEFCVNCPEHVYAVLWDALTAHRENVEAGREGIAIEADPPPQEQEVVEESVNGDNHYVVTGRFENSDDNTRYVLAPTAMEAEDKFRKWMVSEEPNQEDGIEAVIVALVVQIPGPPIAIYAEDVEENPQPLL